LWKLAYERAHFCDWGKSYFDGPFSSSSPPKLFPELAQVTLLADCTEVRLFSVARGREKKKKKGIIRRALGICAGKLCEQGWMIALYTLCSFVKLTVRLAPLNTEDVLAV